MLGIGWLKRNFRSFSNDYDDAYQKFQEHSKMIISGTSKAPPCFRYPTKIVEILMKLALIGAALVAVALAAPASAQEVITNPGKCAQYYPNANCQNYGAGNPNRGGGYQAGNWDNSYNRMGEHTGRRHHRHHRHMR
jgi:hypothetical protein